MAKHIIKKEEAKEIHILRDDGSIWEAQINTEGQLELVREIKAAPNKGSGTPPPEPPKPEPQPEPESKKEEAKEKPETSPEAPESESEPEPEKGEGEGESPAGEAPEPSEGEPEPSPFDDIEPEDSMGEIMEGFSKKGGGKGATNAEEFREDQPKEISGIPPQIDKNLKDHAFRARLSSVMLDNKYDRMLKGRTRGKLDMTRLYKVPTQSRSVFTQKQARRGKQYNVMLLVDESGSMGSQGKSFLAAECAVFLAKQFEGININISIIGFNHYVTVRKEFTGKADYDRIYEAIAQRNWGRGSGDNNDWDALNKAYHMFHKAPDGKNILIMLSDGAPASSRSVEFINIKGKPENPPSGSEPATREKRGQYWHNEKKNLHHLVEANKDRVTSIGIGIMEGGWQIPDHVVVKNLNELKPAIIGQLKKHIKRG